MTELVCLNKFLFLLSLSSFAFVTCRFYFTFMLVSPSRSSLIYVKYSNAKEYLSAAFLVNEISYYEGSE
jgi:hypothetical protein